MCIDPLRDVCWQAAHRSVSETGALCPVFDKPEQGLDLLVEAITAANLTPGEDIHIAINAAAHEMFEFVRTLPFCSSFWGVGWVFVCLSGGGVFVCLFVCLSCCVTMYFESQILGCD